MTPIYPTMQIAATRHVARIGSYQDLAAPRVGLVCNLNRPYQILSIPNFGKF